MIEMELAGENDVSVEVQERHEDEKGERTELKERARTGSTIIVITVLSRVPLRLYLPRCVSDGGPLRATCLVNADDRGTLIFEGLCIFT